MKKKISNNKELIKIPSFDFENSKPNKFAGRYKDNSIVIVRNASKTIILAPDVAKYFPDSKSVNMTLRSLISSFSKIKSKM